ncbi:hypothetical protein GCM10018980_16300 [Streptomyces capoamus]|uniref:Uncharacterized protein n=1 Tax=Streptomyces capoamus TaxID=68183 RepID=A0A919C1A8_9ACTN|nr:hypothetical protein GCM10010501_18240 [Streptomyces libani subsp. rufus]GHG41287.1 hypothetical protein GCM10018980_16300 [Streptomyces capoamus]
MPLTDPSIDTINTDVMALGDRRTDTDLVLALVDRIPGMRGVYAGRLRNAHQIEAFVANLISVNNASPRPCDPVPSRMPTT